MCVCDSPKSTLDNFNERVFVDNSTLQCRFRHDRHFRAITVNGFRCANRHCIRWCDALLLLVLLMLLVGSQLHHLLFEPSQPCLILASAAVQRLRQRPVRKHCLNTQSFSTRSHSRLRICLLPFGHGALHQLVLLLRRFGGRLHRTGQTLQPGLETRLTSQCFDQFPFDADSMFGFRVRRSILHTKQSETYCISMNMQSSTVDHRSLTPAFVQAANRCSVSASCACRCSNASCMAAARL